MGRYEKRKGFKAGNAGERPECLRDKHLKYLDALRESGVTNMFGAQPYLEGEFPGLSESEASDVLGYWMKTFEERHK